MLRMAKAAQVVIFLATLSLTFACSAAAQTRGAAIGRSMPVRSVPIRTSGFRPMQRAGTPLQPNFGPISSVPGLSFNIQALAPADRRDRRRSRFATPLLGYSPFYSSYLDYSYDEPQPPYDDQQQSPPQTAPQPRQFAAGEPASANAEPQPPPPEVGQFVLVRLDGQVLFAVAFTTVNSRLTYVTREGLRRSFPVAELDKDATRQMNEANGTSISLPD